MSALKASSWISFGFSGLSVLFAMGLGAPVFVGAAISFALGGVVLLGLDTIVVRLTEIRDALTMRTAADLPETAATEAATTPRSAAEIAADLERLRSRN